jgi:aryl-alcohol dehydrogenase-like predicted oxidoreductase
MEKHKLGHTGLEVAPLAFGGNVFGWTVDEPTSFRLLDAFCGAGFNLIDTADSYSRWAPGHQGGESETIIGRWIARRGRHDDVVIATKVGSDMGLGYKCLRKDYIVQAVEQSLRRLQVDAIDLYQSHWDDDKTPLEETLEAYAVLVKQGKVKAIGASNITAQLYNLYDRSTYEGPLEKLCVREQIGVITYFSLGAGFLTGKYRTKADFAKSQRGPGMEKYLNPRGMRILDALDAVALRYGVTPARVALAWLSARPSVTAPIASATSTAQLDELIAATRLKLDTDAMQALDRGSACQE